MCACIFLLYKYAMQNVFSPLHLAAHMGHTELVEILILSGANVNSVAKVSFNVVTYVYVTILRIMLVHICIYHIVQIF